MHSKPRKCVVKHKWTCIETIKMKKILYILILIGSPLMPFAVKQDLFVRLSENTKVLLYDSTQNQVIDTLQHNVPNADFVMLKVDSCRGEMIYVQPYWSLDGELYSKKGWVRLSEDITIYPHNNEFPLYASPSYSSDTTTLVQYFDELPVLKYSNGWVYTKVYDYTGKNVRDGFLLSINVAILTRRAIRIPVGDGFRDVLVWLEKSEKNVLIVGRKYTLQ